MAPDTHGWHPIDSIFQEYAKKMRKSRFPPFGFVSSEFGLCALFLQWFLAVFDFMDLTFFLKITPERCTRVGFPPSGSYQTSLGSAHSFCNWFWRFSNFIDRGIDF